MDKSQKKEVESTLQVQNYMNRQQWYLSLYMLILLIGLIGGHYFIIQQVQMQGQQLRNLFEQSLIFNQQKNEKDKRYSNEEIDQKLQQLQDGLSNRQNNFEELIKTQETLTTKMDEQFLKMYQNIFDLMKQQQSTQFVYYPQQNQFQQPQQQQQQQQTQQQEVKNQKEAQIDYEAYDFVNEQYLDNMTYQEYMKTQKEKNELYFVYREDDFEEGDVIIDLKNKKEETIDEKGLDDKILQIQEKNLTMTEVDQFNRNISSVIYFGYLTDDLALLGVQDYRSITNGAEVINITNSFAHVAYLKRSNRFGKLQSHLVSDGKLIVGFNTNYMCIYNLTNFRLLSMFQFEEYTVVGIAKIHSNTYLCATESRYIYLLSNNEMAIQNKSYSYKIKHQLSIPQTYADGIQIVQRIEMSIVIGAKAHYILKTSRKDFALATNMGIRFVQFDKENFTINEIKDEVLLEKQTILNLYEIQDDKFIAAAPNDARIYLIDRNTQKSSTLFKNKYQFSKFEIFTCKNYEMPFAIIRDQIAMYALDFNKFTYYQIRKKVPNQVLYESGILIYQANSNKFKLTTIEVLEAEINYFRTFEF